MKLAMIMAWCAVASADSLARKAPPSTTAMKDLQTFAEAQAFEAEGDFSEAIHRYDTLGDRVPLALYDAGVDELARQNVTRATTAFTRYLKLVPDAPEAQAIARTLDAIAKAPIEFTIGAYMPKDIDPRAITLVDGKVVGNTPVTVKLPPGPHTFERVQPGHYYATQLNPTERKVAIYMGNNNTSSTGNVIISLDVGYFSRWIEGNNALAANSAFNLPVGHYKVDGETRGDHAQFCAPFEFDVASTNEVTYVRLDGIDTHAACWTPKRVTVQRLLKATP